MRAPRRDEAGETLIELVIAMAIFAVVSVGVLLALQTAIMGSATYRKVATMDTELKTASSLVTSQIQATPTAFTCPSTYNPTTVKLPSGYSVTSYTLQWWLGSAKTSTCTPHASLFITLVVSGQGQSGHISFIVDDPHARTVVSGATPTELIFTRLPVHATVGGTFAPPVTVEIVNSAGAVVTGDLSQMSLSIATGPGALSSTCSGTEAYGVFTFSYCSVNKAGTYKFLATDSTDGLTATSSPVVVGTQPTVVVTNNSVPAGGTLVFTATVSGSSGTPTPKGSVAWTVSTATGTAVACSSTTGPTGSSNSVVYTCSVAGAVAGVYTAAAAFPGTTGFYGPSTGFDNSATVTGPPHSS